MSIIVSYTFYLSDKSCALQKSVSLIMHDSVDEQQYCSSALFCDCPLIRWWNTSIGCRRCQGPMTLPFIWPYQKWAEVFWKNCRCIFSGHYMLYDAEDQATVVFCNIPQFGLNDMIILARCFRNVLFLWRHTVKTVVAAAISNAGVKSDSSFSFQQS